MRQFRIVMSLAALTLCTAGSDWPQFLGPLRNGSYIGPEASTFSLRDTQLAWKRDIGAGFSAPVVVGTKLILFHRRNDKEVVECAEAATGHTIWTFDYPTTYRDDFGFDEGPRGTPSVADGRVYTFGAEGVLHAIDFGSGKKIWRVDTHAKFGVRKGFFGAAASPLVEGSAVYVNVGGPNGAGLVAFDKNTGTVLWTATNDEAGYSSPVAATIAGIRSILCLTRSGLVAADPATGKIRFQFPWRSRNNASVNAAVPIVVGDLIFLSATYNTGAVLLSVQRDKLTRLWSSDEVLSNHYSTSVYKDGFVYGYHGRQEYGQALRCVELKTGKVAWTVDDFGAGTVSLIGDRLLLLRESGEAVIATANSKTFQIQSKSQLLPGPVRSYPAFDNKHIYLRNEHTIAAYSISQSK